MMKWERNSFTNTYTSRNFRIENHYGMYELYKKTPFNGWVYVTYKNTLKEAKAVCETL